MTIGALAPIPARILCVDDEPHVLEGLERILFEHFEVVTALSGAEGLDAIRSDGPFSVVVSDMRMPEMDGATFLARVRELEPNIVRVLLTGQTDVESAIAAVNEGRIFRFLGKPCPQERLVESLQAAVEYYQLVNAERELLEDTLNGAIKMLVDVLSLAAPVAFSRTGLLKSCVTHMSERLGLHDKWKYEMAAMLSQIGCIALSPDILDKVFAGQPISAEEQQLLDAHPETGYKLLASIPRLEFAAEVIKRQNTLLDEAACDDDVRLGASMLQVALQVDRLVTAGESVKAAVSTLQERGGYDLRLLRALQDFQGYQRSEVVRAVRVQDLSASMVLDEDVRDKNGNLIVAKGREVDGALIDRLRNFAQGIGVMEPFRVRLTS